MKHCVSLEAFSAREVEQLVQTALRIKRDPARFEQALRGRWLLMLFQKTSTRTRLSFEMGIGKLGGHAVVMDWEGSNFAISPLRYEAHYVGRQVDLIMARLKSHENTLELARHATAPVINGCDDRFHPCQALADLLTVYEQAGTFAGQTLSFVGIHNNVANSLALACARVGLHLILVTPEVNEAAYDAAMMRELEAAGTVERSDSLQEAARRSQFVYTDTWVDMEFFTDDSFRDEKERRVALMTPYQLNAENLAGSDAYIMHDMPVHPGYEVSAEILDEPRTLMYRQAENRMYVQQALMMHLLGVDVD